MQFFLQKWRSVSISEIQKLKKIHSTPKITKAKIRQVKIDTLRDLWVDVKMTIATEDLDALCTEYKVVVNETTILNNIKQ